MLNIFLVFTGNWNIKSPSKFFLQKTGATTEIHNGQNLKKSDDRVLSTNPAIKLENIKSRVWGRGL